MAELPTDRKADQEMPRRRDLPARPAGSELMIRDPVNGRVHFLNATAAAVWECCDGETMRTDCERRLRSRFEVPEPADLQADIQAVLQGFSEKGLLDA